MKRWANAYQFNATPDEKALIVTYDGGDPDEYVVGYLIEYDDDKPVRVIGTDGGEPEDQTLGRDWSWVAPALNAAYEAGRTGK